MMGLPGGDTSCSYYREKLCAPYMTDLPERRLFVRLPGRGHFVPLTCPNYLESTLRASYTTDLPGRGHFVHVT